MYLNGSAFINIRTTCPIPTATPANSKIQYTSRYDLLDMAQIMGRREWLVNAAGKGHFWESQSSLPLQRTLKNGRELLNTHCRTIAVEQVVATDPFTVFILPLLLDISVIPPRL